MKIRRFNGYELEFLEANRKKMTIQELADHLGRTRHSISTKLSNMKWSTGRQIVWSDDEIELLKKLAPTHTTGQIAKRVNRTTSAVYSKATKLGIVCRVSKYIYSKDEEEYLRKNVGKKTIAHMSLELGRTRPSVRCKLHHMKLYSPVFHRWTKSEDAVLIKNAGKCPMKKVAEELNRSLTSVEDRCIRLGIKWHQGCITVRGIARTLGISYCSARRYLRTIPCVPPISDARRGEMYKGGKHNMYQLNTDLIPKIAQAILDNPISANRCHASFKRLEAAVAGEWDDSELYAP